MQQWIARVRIIWKELLQNDMRRVRLLLVIELVFGFALVACLLLLIEIFL